MKSKDIIQSEHHEPPSSAADQSQQFCDVTAGRTDLLNSLAFRILLNISALRDRDGIVRPELLSSLSEEERMLIQDQYTSEELHPSDDCDVEEIFRRIAPHDELMEPSSLDSTRMSGESSLTMAAGLYCSFSLQ